MFDLVAIAIASPASPRIFAVLLRAGAGLMSAADAFGLGSRSLVLAYLVYALFRGERF